MIKRVKSFKTALPLYCVTKITKSKDKTVQTQSWFDNLEEARLKDKEEKDGGIH